MTVVFQNNPIKRQSWPMKAMQNLFQGNLNRLIINHYIRYKYRFKMKKHLFTIGILSVLLITTGCKQTEEKARHIPGRPTDGSPDRPFRTRKNRRCGTSLQETRSVEVEPGSPPRANTIPSEMPGSPSPRQSSYRIAMPLSHSTTRASTTGNKVFRANGMASRHWLINGTTR